jgi:hypothetical protein
VALLEDLMHHNKRLEGLDLIGENWLDAKSRPEGDGRVVIPGVHNAFCEACQEFEITEPRGAHVLRTCFCFGALSSALVAFLMLTASSCSALSLSTGRVG